ncbi:MAG TPA: non-ribosomal peptide synthetase, partial [Pyrinomonadaceae bacterium]|nr:non-ribosomal peptide synthetase [Pyrinomonadaceae bacterium]
RLSYLVADSGANTLLTSRSLFDLAAGLCKRVLLIEELLEEAAAPSAVNVEIEPTDVACLMYTSNATGKPQGVAITHRNILKLVKGITYVSISDDDVIAQIGLISVDGSLFEIWGALLNGATLAVYPPRTTSLSELGAFIRDSEITLLLITTALFRQMIESNAADLRSVRQLITGGEAMSPAVASAAFKNLPRTKLFNAYGPTECTTFSSIYPMTNIAAIGDNVPIGRPVENTTLYILDRDANLLPLGAVGEICIGGDGVASGYWNQTELTARHFVADPFSEGRMFRTGDLGKYRADGNIVLRRPIEIETAIATHPSDLARDENVLPQTRTEHVLVDLLQEVLGAEHVRVTDNFFDLGGHSLVATRLLSRVRETFQTEITMGQFFDNPTVAGLAAIVSANGKAKAAN